MNEYIEDTFISEFDGWDQFSDFGRQFYQAKLNQDLGPFKKGDIVENFVFEPDGRVIQIYSDGKLVFEHKVKLVLEDK